MKKVLVCVVLLVLVLNVGCACAAECGLCQNGTFVCAHEAGNICKQCGGTVGGYRFSCDDCYGKGYVSCSYCSGTGKMSCFVCGGDGIYTSKSGVSIRCTAGCSYGKTACWMCKNGRLNCSSCSSTGLLSSQYLCASCGERLVCRMCYDVNNISCHQCGGNNAVDFKYNTVMRTPDNNIGKAFALTGQIVWVENIAPGASICVLRDTSGVISHDYEVHYLFNEGGLRVLAGDIVNVTGYFVSYDKNNVPMFVTNQLSLVE